MDALRHQLGWYRRVFGPFGDWKARLFCANQQSQKLLKLTLCRHKWKRTEVPDKPQIRAAETNSRKGEQKWQTRKW